MQKLIGLMLGAVILASNVSAETTFTSPVQQTRFVELYTSEGCSSCPPADKWLSRFKAHPGLWKDIVPVAFHVDYWDYIGWKDRFAKKEYGERQYLYRVQGNIKQVYTPGIVLNGSEWRGWFRGKKTLNNNTRESGVLSLTVNSGEFTAAFSSTDSESHFPENLNIAVLGFDLKTPVRAGENEGALLNHDFVVLAMKTFESKNNQWQGAMPKPGIDLTDKKAVVAWVSHNENIRPVQAVGGWLQIEK